MFHFDRGLKLTKADLAVDFRRRQPRAFVSHAHCDHMARHEYALCTPATSALYQFRYGERPTRHMPYGEPLEWGGLRLTTFPAGHCLGSAMLLAEDGDRSLLYTGDFKLGESATAERAQLPRADMLVIESTYGNPFYRHPPRDRVLDQLFTLVRAAIDQGRTPVVEAYIVGKSQEVTRLLTAAGFPVLQHPKIYEISASLPGVRRRPGRLPEVPRAAPRARRGGAAANAPARRPAGLEEHRSLRGHRLGDAPADP